MKSLAALLGRKGGCTLYLEMQETGIVEKLHGDHDEDLEHGQ